MIEKETLALIMALKLFDVYVSGSAPVVVFTDHNPLTFLNSLQCLNQIFIRWVLFLQYYFLDVRYVKGVDNAIADALSRTSLVKLFLSSVYSVSSGFLNCFLGAPVAEPKVEMRDAEDWNGGG